MPNFTRIRDYDPRGEIDAVGVRSQKIQRCVLAPGRYGVSDMDNENKEIEINAGAAGETAGETAADELTPFEILDKFLDARTAKEKIEILSENSSHIDERLIGNIEASLDLPGGNGTLWQRIEYVMYCLRTKSRFETDRLR